MHISGTNLVSRYLNMESTVLECLAVLGVRYSEYNCWRRHGGSEKLEFLRTNAPWIDVNKKICSLVKKALKVLSNTAGEVSVSSLPMLFSSITDELFEKVIEVDMKKRKEK